MSKLTQQTINLAPGLELPIDAVTESFAIIGRRGSGKTHTASVLGEGILQAGQQLVIIDPTNAWWGFRSSADGKRDGFPIPIFGGGKGNKADVEVDDTMGRDLADAIIESGISAIVCVRDFSNAGVRRFVADFAEQLYDRKCEKQFRTPLHLALDEADLVVPQHVQKGGERAYGAIDKIVRRGRIDGFGTSLISQRPAVIAKDVLTQTEVMIAHQVTGPHDQVALKAWVEKHGAKDKLAEFLRTLPGLQKGEAWFWSPAWLEIFQRITTRPRTTWDSGRTPKVGEVLPEPAHWTPVDVEEIRKNLLPKAPPGKTGKGKRDPAPPLDVSSVDAAELEGLREENARLRQELAAASAVQHERALSRIGQAVFELSQAAELLTQERLVSNEPQPETAAAPALGKQAPERLPSRVPVRTPAPTDLPKGQAVILGAIIQHHPIGCTREQLTVLTGYKRSSRDTYLQQLRQAGLLDESGGQLVATKAGLKKMPDVEPLPTGSALRRHWLDELPKGEALVLSKIPTNGRAVTRDYISQETDYQRSSRDTYVQRLAARRLIVVTTSGIALSEHLR